MRNNFHNHDNSPFWGIHSTYKNWKIAVIRASSLLPNIGRQLKL